MRNFIFGFLAGLVVIFAITSNHYEAQIEEMRMQNIQETLEILQESGF